MRIAFLGDLAFVGKYDTTKSDMNTVCDRFRVIKSITETCDYVVANLESPLTGRTTTREYKTLALRTAKCNVGILKAIGVDAVTLANNHTYDYGEEGLNDTVSTLENAGISIAGIDGRILEFSMGDQTAHIGAFCCLSTNAWHYDIQNPKGRLNTLTYTAVESFLNKSVSDQSYPIISVHWGQENTHYPNRDHIQMADRIMDAYRCTIVGHHPHVIQGRKSYPGGDVAFSLGNGCFDDLVSDKTSLKVKQTAENLKSLVMIVDVKDSTHASYEYYPIMDDKDGMRLAPEVLKDLEKYSRGISEIGDIEAYDRVRAEEQREAMTNRLGKRNLEWLISHLNHNSVMTVYQRKQNIKNYQAISDAFYQDKYEKVIAYVGNFDRPELSAAGKRVYGNALAIRDAGYKVILIGKSRNKDIRNKTTIEISSDITYVSFPEYGMIRADKYISWLKKYLAQHRYRLSAVIRYGSPCLAIFDVPLAKFAHSIGTPIITDVVDWLSADGSSFIFNLVKTMDTWYEKAVLYKKSDAVIAISEYLKDYYIKSVKNVIVVPPLVEKYEDSVYLSQAPGLRIVYAGSPFRKGVEVKDVHKIKDRLDLAVQSIATAVLSGADIYFDVYGLTREEYLIAFPGDTDLISRTENNISFHGRVDMQTVQEKVREADFTILLRERNRATMAGFPTKVVESMSCGTPVITTDTSDLSSYIVNGKNGFIVDASDINLLRDMLLSISQMSKDEIHDMKNACGAYGDFLFENHIKTVHELLLAVLN